MTPDDVIVSIELCLEVGNTSILVCVISVAVGIGVFKSQEAKKGSLNRVKKCTYRKMT